MPIQELPFRCIDADDVVASMMAERGETLEDVLWCTPSCDVRCSDFQNGILRTKRHVYTVVKDDWLGDGGYTCRVFVSEVRALAARSPEPAGGNAGADAGGDGGGG